MLQVRNGAGNYTKFYYKFHNVRLTRRALYFYMPPGAWALQPGAGGWCRLWATQHLGWSVGRRLAGAWPPASCARLRWRLGRPGAALRWPPPSLTAGCRLCCAALLSPQA